jgi:ATP-dependent Lhr-like helicase
MAKLLRRNFGSILTEDSCNILLRTPCEEDDTRTEHLGEVDQIYAERLQLGDRFVLEGRCLELKKRETSALLVDEVFGRPQAPRWLGTGLPMASELARRIFHLRMQAGEALRDGDDALHAWLGEEFQLNPQAIDCLAPYFQQQESVSEIPTLTALSIECVSMQACMEYFVHTPLPRSANEAIARVLLQRRRRTKKTDAVALAADLGLYLLVYEEEAMPAESWRVSLQAEQFANDFHEHLQTSDLLGEHFARVAQTGLMVLRNPAGQKRKVGGKDWTERRLYEQIRTRFPDFFLLRQARAEVVTSTCDLASACAFVESLPAMQIRVRHLAQASPFGESLLQAGFRSSAITGEERQTTPEYTAQR